MDQQFPYPQPFDGVDRWVYPHRVHANDYVQGRRKVTVAGTVIGSISKVRDSFQAFDASGTHVGAFDRQFRAADLLATRDFARRTWLDEAKRNGAFGTAAQRWAHAILGGVIDNVHEDLPQVVIEHSTVRSGGWRQAVIKVDGESVGLLVCDTYGGDHGDDAVFYALDAQGAERGKSTTFYNAAVGELLLHLGIPSHYQPHPRTVSLVVDDGAEPVFVTEELPTDDGSTEFSADWDEADASIAPDQVPWADTPEARDIAEAVREFDELPAELHDQVRELLRIEDPVGPARAWREAAQPRDYTTRPRDAHMATVAVLQNHSPLPTTSLAVMARRLITLAGAHHRFCVEKVTQAGLSGPGPHLCGAPLNDDGSCPAARGHRAVQARHDRDLQLSFAKSALHKAAQQQAYTEGSDALFELVDYLEDQVDRVIALLAEVEK